MHYSTADKVSLTQSVSASQICASNCSTQLKGVTQHAHMHRLVAPTATWNPRLNAGLPSQLSLAAKLDAAPDTAQHNSVAKLDATISTTQLPNSMQLSAQHSAAAKLDTALSTAQLGLQTGSTQHFTTQLHTRSSQHFTAHATHTAAHLAPTRSRETQCPHNSPCNYTDLIQL